MFHLGIFAESGANIVHVGVQFIFGNIKCGRVDIYSFEIYQVGRQLEQCIYIFESYIHYCPVKILDLEINRVDHHPLGR